MALGGGKGGMFREHPLLGCRCRDVLAQIDHLLKDFKTFFEAPCNTNDLKRVTMATKIPLNSWFARSSDESSPQN